MGRTRLLNDRGDAPPVFTYDAAPGAPPASAMRIGRGALDQLPPGAHSHDFLVLDYFERGGGSVRLEGRRWPVEAGDVYIVAPGEIGDPSGLEDAEGWAVIFLPEILGSQAPGAFFSWRAHPLLFPFVGGAAGGAQRLKVPPEERSSWSGRFSALERELRERRDGYREAVLAHLTLLLVEVARLAHDVAGEFRLNDEPLLARVFGYIEERYREPISLKEVARAVSLTPGHLTTVVKRKTGRTVVGWIAERRMTEARRLLAETGLPVEEVGRRSGYRDPTHFTRYFKRAHGVTPLGWRRAGRSTRTVEKALDRPGV